MEDKNYNEKFSADLVEFIYSVVKTEVRKGKYFHSKEVFALAELFTELANRLKVEENCG